MSLRRIAVASVRPLVGLAFTGLWFVAEFARFPNLAVFALLGLAIAVSRLLPRVALISTLVALLVASASLALFPRFPADFDFTGYDYPTTWFHPIGSTDWPAYAAVLIVPALVAATATGRRVLWISGIAAAVGAIWLAALIAFSQDLPWNHGRLIQWVNPPFGLTLEGHAFIAFGTLLVVIGAIVWLAGWGAGGVVRIVTTVFRDPVLRVRINDAFGLRRAESAGLTARERDVLLLVSDGKSNAEIAAALFLSEATVKSHLRSILSKLGLKSRTEIAAYAWKTGLVQLV